MNIDINKLINKINKETTDLLVNRLLFNLGVVLLLRVGTFLPIPGINNSDIAFYIQEHSAAKNLLSTFSGDKTFVLSLFTLNIFPYINATIFVQLLLGFSPKLAKLQKEGDFEGRRSINRLTRFLTLIWAVVQSVSIVLYLKQILFDWNYFLAFETVLSLTTGAMIVLWLSELIKEYGVGNGPSLLIYTNIISNLPHLVKKLIIENSDAFSKIILGLVCFSALCGIILLQKSIRQIPLISSKQLYQFESKYVPTNYLPVKFNQAGIMPIILTTAILVIPNSILNLGIFQWLNLPTAFEFVSWFYWISYFGLILLFSNFYSSVVLNPKEISDQLQKMSVTIPGIRPGAQTTFYLQQVIKRITLMGSTMLATLAVLPNFIESKLNIAALNGLSTTSLLIVAGVTLDVLNDIGSVYLRKVYE